MTASIEQKIRTFVESGFCQAQTIEPDQDILAAGVLDSLGVANLLAFVETEFALKIPLEDVTVENFSTTSSIANFVSDRLKPN